MQTTSNNFKEKKLVCITCEKVFSSIKVNKDLDADNEILEGLNCISCINNNNK